MNWAWLNSFLTAAAQVSQLIIVISQHNWEQDKELKRVKEDLRKEWVEAMASRDKSRIAGILQRLRDFKG